MEVQAPFGFVTGCHAGDKFMVGATLASMRHYCPDVPICLIADGDVDVSDLKREYDLIVLRIADLPLQKMRKIIGGSYRVKLAAMWEGPFEHYVWMDSDAIVWGDFAEQVRADLDFQIFWPEISIRSDAKEEPAWLAHFYFDMGKLKKFDPDFEWRGHPYFSAGVYACRRNVISYEQWQEVEGWARQEPSLFQFGDQGILNYLVHAKSQRGAIKVECSDLQWSRSYDRSGIEKDCKHAGWQFPEKVDKPMVLHFCGSKPHTTNFKCFSRPFTIARLAHHRRYHNSLGAWWTILLEDLRVSLAKLKGRCKSRLA
jgi:lipopolysaccharide biosynthesis glycosyltransferase